MSVNPKTLQCWIVTEGMAGTENQCLGVAEALGVTPVVHRIALRQPWKFLSPYIGLETSWTFKPAFTGPWPDLLLASGRKSIAASRYIKKMSGGKTFTVQIQDPRISPKHFDLVAVPEHDPTRGDNVITTVAAANRLNGYKLEAAKTDFASIFAMLPGPRVGVLLGGNSKAHTMTQAVMQRLGAQLSGLPGTPLITASRRTGEDEKQAFLEALGDKPHYFWDGTGANPYFGILAWADYILVTADSVSMLGDAATTGKPVYMISMEGGSSRFDKFHANLIEKGYIRPFEGTLEHWHYQPLADSAHIADEIRRRMELA
jgi:uncharacterized protein